MALHSYGLADALNRRLVYAQRSGYILDGPTGVYAQRTEVYAQRIGCMLERMRSIVACGLLFFLWAPANNGSRVFTLGIPPPPKKKKNTKKNLRHSLQFKGHGAIRSQLTRPHARVAVLAVVVVPPLTPSSWVVQVEPGVLLLVYDQLPVGPIGTAGPQRVYSHRELFA